MVIRDAENYIAFERISNQRYLVLPLKINHDFQNVAKTFSVKRQLQAQLR